MCGCDSVPGRGTFGCVLMDIYLNRDATVLRKSTREDSEMAHQGKRLATSSACLGFVLGTHVVGEERTNSRKAASLTSTLAHT